jgi:hypothetical protein
MQSLVSLRPLACLLGVTGALLLAPAPAPAQGASRGPLPAWQLENALDSLGIRYTRVPFTSGAGHMYVFRQNGRQVELHYYDGGEVLMLKCCLRQSTFRRVNAWNIREIYSRAVLYRINDRDTAALELALDCRAGLTAGAVRQFLRRFQGRLAAFDAFLGRS